MDSEEKPELTVKFMKYAAKALQWAQKDQEVNNVLHLDSYRRQISDPRGPWHAWRPFYHDLFDF